MATFDMTTTEGLRDSCREAERRLDRDPEKVARNARFLQEVQESSAEERESEAFLRRVWDENPLYDLDRRTDTDVTAVLADPEFRRWFRELTDGPLPEDPQARAERLDAHIAETCGRVRGDRPSGPHVKTTRTFAALFPHDFTTHRSSGRKERLYKRLGGLQGTVWDAQACRFILDHLDAAIGPVDRSDWNAVARRMMLPEVLYEISVEQRQASDRGPTISAPGRAPSVDWPKLPQIAEHFESIREAGTLVFDQKMVAVAPSRPLDARTPALRGAHRPLGNGQDPARHRIRQGRDWRARRVERSNLHDCGAAGVVRFRRHCSGYVNPLGENRYVATEFLGFLIRANENPSQTARVRPRRDEPVSPGTVPGADPQRHGAR